MSGIKDQSHSTQPQQHDCDAGSPFGNSVPAVSPAKAVDLGMKNYQQLHFLQQLFEDGILDEEYTEQKGVFLCKLKRLHTNNNSMTYHCDLSMLGSLPQLLM